MIHPEHLVPSRVAGPVGYTPRERAAITESMPASQAAAAQASQAAAAARQVDYRRKQQAEAAAQAVEAGVSTEAAAAQTPAREARPVPVCAAQRRAERQAEQVEAAAATPAPAEVAATARGAAFKGLVLAALPTDSTRPMSRGELMAALGLSRKDDIKRADNVLARLLAGAVIGSRYLPSGLRGYWRVPEAGDPASQPLDARRQALLDALPDNPGQALELGEVMARLGPDTGKDVVVGMLRRLAERQRVGIVGAHGRGIRNRYYRRAEPVEAEADALDYDSAFELAPGLEEAPDAPSVAAWGAAFEAMAQHGPVARACPLNGQPCECPASDLCAQVAAGEHGPAGTPPLGADDHAAGDALAAALNAAAEPAPTGDLPGDAVLHAEIPDDLGVWHALQLRAERYSLIAEAFGQLSDQFAGWAPGDALAVLREAAAVIEGVAHG